MKKILSYFFIINLVLFGLIACETSDNSTGFYTGDSLATKKTNQVEDISVEQEYDHFTEKEWKAIYKLSENTFVEETESLKQEAAGAGLTDNDW